MTPNASDSEACRLASRSRRPGKTPTALRTPFDDPEIMPQRWDPKHPFAVSVLCVLLALPIKLAFDTWFPRAPSTILFPLPRDHRGMVWRSGARAARDGALVSDLLFFLLCPIEARSPSTPWADEITLFLVESVLISVLSGSLHQAQEQVESRSRRSPVVEDGSASCSADCSLGGRATP